MSDIKKDSAQFMGYEYKELAVSGEWAAFYLDCYQNFGWVPDGRTQESGGAKGRLVLKRERKIINKAELTRLQRHFEACVDEIRALEKSKTSNATMWAILVALIGTAFMAGATFAVTLCTPPLYLLCTVLAVPGFLGWVLPYFVYQKLCAKRSRVVAGLVEQKYDEIYEICQQGSRLLN